MLQVQGNADQLDPQRDAWGRTSIPSPGSVRRRLSPLVLILTVLLLCGLWMASDSWAAGPNPIAAYSFDEDEGGTAYNLDDEYGDLGGEFDAAIHGAEWVGGRYGSALKFEAAEHDYLSVSSASELELTEGFTLEAWVRPTSAETAAPIFTKNSPEGAAYQLLAGGESSGKAEGIVVDESKAAASVTASTALTADRWTYLALTDDGEHLRLFVNGELASSTSASTPRSSEGNLEIGGDQLTEDYFDGLIDDVRIYPGAHGEGEISEDMGIAIQTQPSEEPISEYPFEQPHITHDVTEAHDATIHGAGWREGKYGAALDFQAEDGDYLSIPHSSDLDLTEGFTLEAWIRPTGSYGPLFTDRFKSSTGYELYWEEWEEGNLVGGVVFDGGEEEAYVSAENETPANSWSYVALTSDGEELSLYVNGELIESTPAVDPPSTENDLEIAGRSFYKEYFNGLIDNVRVYGRALNGAELEEDMSTAVGTSPRAGSIAEYSFDDVEAQVGSDPAGGHDATVQSSESAEGKYGSALDLNGESSCVAVPDSHDLELSGGFTVEAWVWPQSSEQDAPLFFKGSGVESFGYAMYLGDEEGGDQPRGLVAGNESTTSEVSSSETLPAETWSHVAMTSDGEELSLYVNGELVDSEATTSAQPSQGDLEIGCNRGLEQYFAGRIDEVRIFDSPLEAGRMTEEAESDHVPPEVQMSGGITEGLEGPGNYPLRVEVTDGSTGKPQSGVTHAEISFDGTTVETKSQSCPKGNCKLNLEWTYEEEEFTEEPHEIEIVAFDGSGNIEEKFIDLPIASGDIPACRPLSKPTPSPPTETSSLPHGGTSRTYDAEGGLSYEILEAPNNFDPLSATNEELKEYGYPPRPEEEDALEDWESAMKDDGSSPLGAPCVELATGSTGEIVNETSGNYSGFVGTEPEGKNVWNAIEADYNQPWAHRQPFCRNSVEGSWIGLGGWDSSALIQAGSNIDRNGSLHPFLEILSTKNEYPAYRLNLAVHRGDRIHIWLKYDAGEHAAHFFIQNRTTRHHFAIRVGEVPGEYYDGSKGAFIDERPVVGNRLLNLQNFGIVHWMNTRVQAIGGGWQRLGTIPRFRLHMQPKAVWQMAAPGFLGADDKSFRDNWFHCRPEPDAS